MLYMFTGWLHRALATLLHCRVLCIENGLQMMQELSLKPVFVINSKTSILESLLEGITGFLVGTITVGKCIDIIEVAYAVIEICWLFAST